MAQVVYECLLIFDPNRYAREAAALAGSVNSLVESLGGEVLVSRLWNEQKLAYPIKGQKKGVYWLAYFKLDTLKLKDLNRACQINEAILRQLTLRVDPRLVDALVAHAQGGRPAPQPAAPEEAEPRERGERGGRRDRGERGERGGRERRSEPAVAE